MKKMFFFPKEINKISNFSLEKMKKKGKGKGKIVLW
jgi:hypothetical protein